jgi:hypothetical protein
MKQAHLDIAAQIMLDDNPVVAYDTSRRDAVKALQNRCRGIAVKLAAIQPRNTSDNVLVDLAINEEAGTEVRAERGWTVERQREIEKEELRQLHKLYNTYEEVREILYQKSDKYESIDDYLFHFTKDELFQELDGLAPSAFGDVIQEHISKGNMKSPGPTRLRDLLLAEGLTNVPSLSTFKKATNKDFRSDRLRRKPRK